MISILLLERLETGMKKAYKEIDTITVTESLDTNNVFQGFNIQFIQHGTGAAFTDKPSSAEFTPYIDGDTYINMLDDDKYTEVGSFTDNFVASASGTDVLITGYKSGAEGSVCDVIGKAHPLSQVKSQCVIYFNGSSASNVTDGYTLGLVASQGNRTGQTKNDYGRPRGLQGELLMGEFVNRTDSYKGDVDDVPPFFWDIAFNWAPGEDGQVIQCISNDDGDDSERIMETITLLETPTNASLQAKYWDAVIFEVSGEKMDVKLKLTGKSTTTTIVSSASTTFGERVKPLGVTCNQLYPKIAIHNNDATNPGTAWLSTWNGHESLGYYDRSYFGLDGLDDPNPILPPQNFVDIVNRIDISSVYTTGEILTRDVDRNIQNYTYKGELAGNKGIDNKYVLITSEYSDKTNDPLYFTTSDQVDSISDNGRLGDILGFPSVADQTQFATIADSGADITFTSVSLPESAPQESMFVRLKNMAINSYNANKQSISNIIYSCPKFDSQGNTGGLLFYEPSERVYVKLNNSEKITVNSLYLDIVNVNEKVLEELTGNTIVVLHFREAK